MIRYAHPLLGAFLAGTLLCAALLVGFLAPAPFHAVAPSVVAGVVLLVSAAGSLRGAPILRHPFLLVGAVWLWIATGLSLSLMNWVPRWVAMLPLAAVFLPLLFPQRLGFHRLGAWGLWPLRLMGPPLDPEDLTLVMLDRLMDHHPDLRRRLFHPADGGPDAAWRAWFEIDAFGCPTTFQWHILGVDFPVDKATTSWLQGLGPRPLFLTEAQRRAGSLFQPIVVPASLGGLSSAHQRMAFAQRLREAKRRLKAQGFDPHTTTWTHAPS